MGRGEYRKYKNYRQALKLSKQAIRKYTEKKWSGSDDFEDLTIRHARVVLLEMLATELLLKHRVHKYKEYKDMTIDELTKEMEKLIKIHRGIKKLKE